MSFKNDHICPNHRWQFPVLFCGTRGRIYHDDSNRHREMWERLVSHLFKKICMRKLYLVFRYDFIKNVIKLYQVWKLQSQLHKNLGKCIRSWGGWYGLLFWSSVAELWQNADQHLFLWGKKSVHKFQLHSVYVILDSLEKLLNIARSFNCHLKDKTWASRKLFTRLSLLTFKWWTLNWNNWISAVGQVFKPQCLLY
jgi:hypothetical protein